MKLHLPLSLRAALLAVLASFSFSYAGETKTVTEEETLEEKTYEDLILIVEDTGKLMIDTTCYIIGTSEIIVKGKFTISTYGYIGYAADKYETAETEITVTNGIFNMSGGCIGYAAGLDTIVKAVINVNNDGIFTLSSGFIGLANGAESSASTEIIVTNGTFNMMNEDTNIMNRGIGRTQATDATVLTDIKVTNGTFNMSNGYIGYAWNSNSTAVTTIEVGGNGAFTLISGSIGRADGRGSSASTMIAVTNGIFNMLGGNIGYTDRTNSTSETKITVINGKFNMSDGYIGYAFSYNAIATTRIIVDNSGEFVLQNLGCIGYAYGYAYNNGATAETEITVTNGTFNMKNGIIGLTGVFGTISTTSIIVNDGIFSMEDGTISYGDGSIVDVTVQGSTGALYMNGGLLGKSRGIVNITVQQDASATMSGYVSMIGGSIAVMGENSHFTQSGGSMTNADIELSNGASFAQSGSGSINGGTITVNDGSSFTQQSGGSIGGDTNIVLKDNAQLTLSENGSMNGHVRMEGAGAQYDIGGQAAGGSIDMKGGSLKNAGSYQGSVSIDIESGYKGGDIDMGGVAADNISSVKVKEGGVSLSGLKAGSTLTLTGSDNTLTVGSGNTDLDGSGGTALIQFEEENGYISFNEDDSNTLVLDLTGAILKNLESQESFIIHLTNGEIIDWSGKNFVFSGLLEGLGFYVEWVENGDLIIRSGDLDNLFRASYVEGLLDDAKRQKNLKDRDAVVMDEDLTIEVGEDFDDDELTLNHVETWVDDDSKTDLDITNKSGKDLDVNLHNDYDTTLDGNLTVKSEGDGSHTDLEKTGEGNLTVTGNVSTDGDLDVQEGGLGVGGDADIGGDVTVGDSENGMEGSLVVGGDLTTDGDLDIEKGEVGVGGSADIGGGVTVGDSESDPQTEGKLIVEGDLDVEEDLNIENGDVEVGGDANIGGSVTVGDSESDPQTEGELIVDGNLDVEGDLDIKNGDVTLNGEDNHVSGDVHFGDEENDTEGNLELNGSLTVDGDVDLSEGKGSITGEGELHIDENGSLTLGENVEFDGPSLDVEGDLNMNDQDVTLGGLNGDGTVNGPGNIIIDGDGGDFSGELTGSGSITVTGEGTDQSFSGVDGEDWDLEVKDGGQLTITGKDGKDSTFHDVEAKSGGKLEFRASGGEAGDHAGANATLTGALVIYNGSTTRFTFNMNADELWGDPQQGLMVTVNGQIFIEKEAQFIVDSLQRGPQMPEGRSGDLVDVVVMKGGDVSVVEKFTEEMLDLAPMAIQEDTALKVTPEGLFRLYYRNVTLTAKSDHTVVLNANYAPYTVLQEEGVATTRNSYAGVMLLSAVGEERLVADPTLSRIGAALGDLIAAGGHAAASRVAAAVAGSTVTSLSAAQRDALRSEMNRLRWHARPAADMQPQRDERYSIITTAKGAIKENTAAPAAATWLHAWAEGDAGHMKRHTQGDESGYCLNTWGGAVGADMSLTESLSAGLSLSAQYGDVNAHAADTAKGDLDSYYLSVYARYKPSKWAHTVMLTGSRSEAKLTRCVDYVQGMYESKGSTSGYGVGAAYELSYDIALNAEGSSLLQPLAGLSIIHTSMGGYSEHGAYGAGLNVARQKQTTGTLTLGMRWLAQVGEGVFGRRATAELSLGMAEDLGDVRSTAQVALQANPAFRQRVYGSRAGRAAAQIGGSITLPVTRSACLYLQGLGELREHANNWNITAGVRVGF